MMQREQVPALVALGGYVASVVSALEYKKMALYPVLGAEGRDFFIDVAAGPFESRQILKTVHVEIRADLDQPVFVDTAGSNDEIFIGLPNAAFLIGLVGLFQRALAAPALVLHPLDDRGDFLTGWDQAVSASSSGNAS